MDGMSLGRCLPEVIGENFRPTKKNMKSAVSSETGTKRKIHPGYSELSGLAKSTSIYESGNTNYKVEEMKILKDQKI